MITQAATRAGRGRNGLVYAQCDAWVRCSFSYANIPGLGTGYVSRQRFQLGVGQRIEIEAEIYKIAGNNLFMGATVDNGSNGYMLSSDPGGNLIIYKVVAASGTAISSTGSVATNNYTGITALRLDLVAVAASNNTISSMFNLFRVPSANGNVSDTAVNMLGSLGIFIVTDSITRCRVRARVVG